MGCTKVEGGVLGEFYHKRHGKTRMDQNSNKSPKPKAKTSGSDLPPKSLIPTVLENCLCITCSAIFVCEAGREGEKIFFR